MASGDAQRVWFPEMLEELRRMWSQAMAWDDLAKFCQRMTKKRKSIREAKGPLSKIPAKLHRMGS